MKGWRTLLPLALALIPISHRAETFNDLDPARLGSLSGFSVRGPYAITVTNQFAYVADGTNGLQIVDVENPLTPKFAGSLPLPDVRGVAVGVGGSNVWVADYKTGIHSIDVTDPVHPKVLGTMFRGGSPHDLAVSWPYAYTAMSSDGVQRVDLTDPLNPNPDGSFQDDKLALSVAIAGRNLLVVENAGLAIWDARNFKSIGYFPFTTAPIAGEYCPLVVSGNTVVVFTFPNVVIDISDPTQPHAIEPNIRNDFSYGSSFGSEIWFQWINYNGEAFIDAPDMSDLTRCPTSFSLGKFSTAMAQSGPLGFFAIRSPRIDFGFGQPATLEIYDLSRKALPEHVGQWSGGPSVANAVAVAGNTVFVGENGVLRVLDATDPANPTLVKSLDFHAPYLSQISIADKYAYVGVALAETGGVAVLDISDPTSPKTVAKIPSYRPAIYPPEFTIAPPLAFVNDFGALSTFDISDPTSPRKIGSLPAQPSVTVEGNRLYSPYFFGGAGVGIFDISDPAAPREIGYYQSTAPCRAVSVSNNVAVVLIDTELQTVDVSEPANPQKIASLDLSGDLLSAGPFRIPLVNGFAYLANSGCVVVDVRDPAHPKRVGSTRAGHFAARDIAVTSNYAFLVQGNGFGTAGLAILKTVTPASPSVQLLPLQNRAGDRRIVLHGAPSTTGRLQRTTNASLAFEDFQTITFGEGPTLVPDDEAGPVRLYRFVSP